MQSPDPAFSLLAVSTSSQRDVTFHVVIDVAEFGIKGGQTLEVMADGVLIGHAVAAMNLHRFLPDQPRGLTDTDLGCRNRTLALGLFGIQPQGLPDR